MTDLPWWKRPFPNLWVRIGTVSSIIWVLGLLLRWVDGSERGDHVAMWSIATVLSLGVLAVGLILARRAGGAGPPRPGLGNRA